MSSLTEYAARAWWAEPSRHPDPKVANEAWQRRMASLAQLEVLELVSVCGGPERDRIEARWDGGRLSATDVELDAARERWDAGVDTFLRLVGEEGGG